MNDPRMSKIEANLLIAKDIALRSPCSRRKFGAILVRDDAIIATGYNGSARNCMNCGIDCNCLKDLHQEETMKSYDHCPAVHAEMNVIINAARTGTSTVGATLYLNSTEDNARGPPCFLCKRFMIQAGIAFCYYIKDDKIIEENRLDWIEQENNWMKKQLAENVKD